MKKLIRVLLFTLTVFTLSFSQTIPPKREFRGAWIATVSNIDWPSQPGSPVAQQQAALISILDQLKSIGMNAVVFQIRPECDAFYQSKFEPWSYWLTGKQGQPPSPFYDPLQFAIEEAHKRGMELHAWINPYRAVNKVGQFSVDTTHVSVRHPDWILSFAKSGGGTLKILNPGLPQVRDYITAVIMDIVRRYDVDGIHFDDYFYPYEGITTQDTATFRLYNRGFTDIGNWRRDNVNIFIKELHDSISTTKPWVKFGISPFGIWKPGYPSGISGLDAYNTLYADAMAWLDQKTVDYLAPQLYWPNGGGQDYGKLMPWWADSTAANGRHLYIGQADYRITAWSPGEMELQIRQNRANSKVQGSIFYNTNVLLSNPSHFADSLKQVYYKYPSLIPPMMWKDAVPPNSVQNVMYAGAHVDAAQLAWNLPTTASDGDSASRYVVYRFNRSGVTSTELDSAQNILLVTDTAACVPPIPSGSGPYYYAVTALDRNWNESGISNVVQVNSPSAPLLASPSDNFMNGRDTTVLQWQPSALASSYSIKIASDSAFAKGILADVSGVSANSFAVTGMGGVQKYFWKISASNAGGTSGFSDTRSFTTAFPLSPLLAAPESVQTNVSLLPLFAWHPTASTTTYRLQVVKGAVFTFLAVDTTISDTSFTLNDSLQANTIYSWRVSSGNEYGFSLWSSSWKFKTMTPAWVALIDQRPSQFTLWQNYPNPFNPATRIRFTLQSSEFTSLKVYNVLGQIVATLVSEEKSPGTYEVELNASALPSGVYIYRLQSGSFVDVKKMLLEK
ncbi:MAG: family 10 glycosylhydrolase [Bacteroidota bacterium]|nr:family 10 glycosylhydrolase [Bacteroidota bacterium]